MNDHRPSQETLEQHDRAVNSIRDAHDARSAEKSKLAILESCILLELALADSGAMDVFKKRSRAPTLLPLIRHYQLTMSRSPAEARVLKEAEEAIKLRNSHVHDAGFKSSVDADVGAAKALLAAARTIVDLPQVDPAAGGVFAMRNAAPSLRSSLLEYLKNHDVAQIGEFVSTLERSGATASEIAHILDDAIVNDGYAWARLCELRTKGLLEELKAAAATGNPVDRGAGLAAVAKSFLPVTNAEAREREESRRSTEEALELLDMLDSSSDDKQSNAWLPIVIGVLLIAGFATMLILAVQYW